MKLKKIIALFLLITVLLMPVAVFADVPIPDPPYDAWQFWVVAQKYGDIILYTSQNPIQVEETSGGNPNKLFFVSLKQYNFVDNEWVYYRDWSGPVETSFEHIYASNHNIAKKDGSGFFFIPPKVSTLYQVAKKTDFGMILRTFSAGLIPLVGLLILVISFRKAWEFLRRQLIT